MKEFQTYSLNFMSMDCSPQARNIAGRMLLDSNPTHKAIRLQDWMTNINLFLQCTNVDHIFRYFVRAHI